MGAFFRSVGRALYVIGSLVFWGAAEVYDTIAPYAPAYLWSLAITAGLWLALIPTFVIVKVLTGWVAAIYIAAFLALLLSAILGFLGTPLAYLIGLLLGVQMRSPLSGRSRSPYEIGERYVRMVGVVLFTELMLALYAVFVPFHRNLGAVPLLLLAAAAVGIGTAIWGGWLSGRFYTGLAAAIAVIITASFWFPETFHVISGQGARVDAGIAGAISGQPMRLLLWGVGLLILAAYVAARALDKPWLKAAAWGLVLLVLVLAMIDRLAWGPGLAAVTAPPMATAVGEIERREIPLAGPDREVPVGALPPWRFKVDQQQVRGALTIRFTDGATDTLAPGEEKTFGRTRYPAAFKGEGTVLLWLCPPPSKACG